MIIKPLHECELKRWLKVQELEELPGSLVLMLMLPNLRKVFFCSLFIIMHKFLFGVFLGLETN